MTRLHRLSPFLWNNKPSLTRCFSRVSRPLISSDILVEEEKLPFYKHEEYYPVHIGEIFQSRYQTVGKLGYGRSSTVWLCKDLSEEKYVSLKILTHLAEYPWNSRAEIDIYKHFIELDSMHTGQDYIRELYDTFEVTGPHGQHHCLVQPPMHLTLFDILKSTSKPVSPPLVKMTLKCLLDALDFLHTEAGIVHTDLKTDNLMLTVEDITMLEDFEKAELEAPSLRKIIDETRSIYLSRRFRTPRNGQWGYPVLCDFGEARIGKVHETGPRVQPHAFRAPEVIFEMPWGPPADIWSVAGLIWELFEDRNLFRKILDEKKYYDPFKHVAQIAGFLGPPPREFISRSETTLQCWDTDGNWIADEQAKIPETSLEQVETRLEGRDKELFLQFIRSMLKWLPEERKTAKELLDDPWLNGK